MSDSHSDSHTLAGSPSQHPKELNMGEKVTENHTEAGEEVAPAALTRQTTLQEFASDDEAKRLKLVKTLSESKMASERSLGRALSRQLSPPVVGPFGSVAPGDGDESGMEPPRDEEEAIAEQQNKEQNSPSQPEKDEYEVTWDGPDDKANPKNWSELYRWYLTGCSGLLVFNATFASSAPSGIVEKVIEDFGFSLEVGTLMIALFVAGYCVGPLVWGPLSEIKGRRFVFLVSVSIYTLFQIGCALAPNTGAILAFRFLGGTFAAGPLTNSGGVLGDIWDADRRGIAFAWFAVAPFAGPAIGPIVSGFMSNAGVRWQDTFWVLFAFAGACFILIVFGIPETYTPTLLQRKAAKLRKETGKPYWAPLDKQKTDLKSRLDNILLKPFKMLALEPMLLLVTIYMSFVYGVIYLMFEAYPIVFTEGHHMSAGVTGLMFLGIFIGGITAVIIYILVFNPRYVVKHKAAAAEGKMVSPEARLETGVIGGVVIVIALFWFGWTSYPSVSWAAPMVAGGFLGLGILWIFLSLFNYIIDVYLFAAASALAANTVCRSAFGAGFPLFATQMYVKLNPRIASTVLGCIAIAMAPIPILFIKFGPALRKRSKFTPAIRKV